MTTCEGCGAEHVLLRDEDDDLYRRVCVCEAKLPCLQKGCKQLVVGARLDRSGEVRKCFCAKHAGLDEVAGWLSPALPEPTPVVKQEKEKKERKEKKDSSPNDVTKLNVPLFAMTCCGRTVVSTRHTFHCCECDQTLRGAPIEKGEMDGVFVRHGPTGTSVIITLKIESIADYVAHDFVISV